ncbi:Protease inhibitor kunitoxin-Tel1 [Trichinella patagoniensis]|uniref:Protease inhibitor kunitoxin-Tel1 n=1 Tax=Trichinella patagoniensis TaxID=990121 RepID=A0A0V0ZN34_9BILA|nr:Protease inhibitor kunitoxin-Tel1 [Trichinella patagoniensis]
MLRISNILFFFLVLFQNGHQIYSIINEWKEVCSLPADVGPCRAEFKRFFYNSEKGVCEEFTYGGCKGNENNFNSFEKCKLHCMTEDKQAESNETKNPCLSNPCPDENVCLLNPNDLSEYICIPMKNGTKIEKMSDGKTKPNDCRTTKCSACQECVISTAFCGGEVPCDRYTCVEKCGLCERCSPETDNCTAIESRPGRWCKVFNPCDNRQCPAYPEAVCVRDECDCFLSEFRQRDGTPLTWKQCHTQS